MARIRSIKPEFWTSEQVVECSPIARLLFVGMWTFSDDGGRHPASVKRLKMEVFPGDDFSEAQMNGWLQELHTNELLLTYVVGEKEFWQITGWHNQKIDKPTIRFPAPDQGEVISASNRRVIGEGSPPEGSLRESSGEEGKKSRSLRFTEHDVEEARRQWEAGHTAVVCAFAIIDISIGAKAGGQPGAM